MGEKETFERAKKYIEMVKCHPTHQSFLKNYRVDNGFYEGYGQWPEAELRLLQARGQKPITNNLIQTLVDHISGVEVSSRTSATFFSSMAFDSGYHTEEDELLAKAVSSYFHRIQAHQNFSAVDSRVFFSMFAFGLGISNLYIEDGIFRYEAVDPTECFFDFDDFSSQLENARFIGRRHWVNRDFLKAKFPVYRKYASGNSGFPENGRRFQRQTMDTQQHFGGDVDLIVEVQLRNTKTAFKGFTQDGFVLRSFDRKALKERECQEIEEYPSTEVLRILYAGDILLEVKPLDGHIPDGKFTYTPCVFTKLHETNEPAGMVRKLRDPQILINTTQARADFLINTPRLVVKGVPDAGSLRRAEMALRNRNGIIMFDPGIDVQILDNANIAQAQIQQQQRAYDQIQKVSGIFDESLGRQTNARSGDAIDARKANTMVTHVLPFENLKFFKKRVAELFLEQFQHGDFEDLYTDLVDRGVRHRILLNHSRKIQGKKEVFNDVRARSFNIFVEEVVEHQSERQKLSEEFKTLLQSPHAPFLLSNPALLKILGVQRADELSEIFRQSMADYQQFSAQQQQETQRKPTQGVI